MNTKASHSLTLLAMISLAVLTECQSPDAKSIEAQVRQELATHHGDFAIAFRDAATGEEILINEKETFHAASTMKTPVMMEVYKQVDAGAFKLSDSILIKNEFSSIVDGSPFSLRPEDDSELELYNKIGQRLPLSEVLYLMIISSSNLATNLIIEWVDARKVTQTMRDIGGKNITVLRGVEDSKAFAQGLNNTVTAYDLMILFDRLAKGDFLNPNACEDMINILKDQRFNEIIPALLPDNTKVAHKTGSIRGVRHDSGIVILPDGTRYTIVMLSKNLTDEPAAIKSMAKVSRMLYDYAVSRR